MNHVHPAFAAILNTICPPAELLEQASDKASARRFTGEPPTGFGGLVDDIDERTPEERSADEPDYQRELQADHVRDMGGKP